MHFIKRKGIIMDSVDKDLLKEISDISGTPEGAYNIRKKRKRDRKKSNRKYKYCSKRRGKRNRHIC